MTNDKKQALIDTLSKVPIEVLQTAYLYAVNYTKYGVDVTITWQTATQNAYALEKAYKDGYFEGYSEGLKK